MKKYVTEFLLKGLIAMGFGPIVLAVIYFILGKTGAVEHLSTEEVALGVVTVAFMAFIAAGITVVYKIEKLPLFYAILLHGVALYFDYILIYLVNGWIKKSLIAILIFSAAFIVGYSLIWLFIYLGTRRSVKELSSALSEVKNTDKP